MPSGEIKGQAAGEPRRFVSFREFARNFRESNGERWKHGEGRAEKRLRGDRKYRRVCTLDSGIHNSRFASSSWRAVSPFRDPKNKTGEKRERHPNSIFARRARVRYREFLIIRAADVIDNMLGVGKNVKGTYMRASRDMTRMTITNASLNFPLARYMHCVYFITVRVMLERKKKINL